jgi:hypothetical protein
MIMERLLNVLTVFSLALVGFVILSLRRAHIRVEYSMSWLGAAVALLALSRLPRFLDAAAGFLGIQDPPSVLLLMMVCILFVVGYRSSIVISHLKDANIALAQKVAMLDFEVRSLHEKIQTTDAR